MLFHLVQCFSSFDDTPAEGSGEGVDGDDDFDGRQRNMALCTARWGASLNIMGKQVCEHLDLQLKAMNRNVHTYRHCQCSVYCERGRRISPFPRRLERSCVHAGLNPHITLWLNYSWFFWLCCLLVCFRAFTGSTS